jgi:hypothetical protein
MPEMMLRVFEVEVLAHRLQRLCLGRREACDQERILIVYRHGFAERRAHRQDVADPQRLAAQQHAHRLQQGLPAAAGDELLLGHLAIPLEHDQQGVGLMSGVGRHQTALPWNVIN